MSKNKMTSKERIEAAMRNEPLDRLPFWPKLDPAYENKWGKTNSWFHEFIGSDYMGGVGNSFREIRRNTSYSENVNGPDFEAQFITPNGTLVQRKRFDVDSQSWHPTEFPIKTKQDLGIMASWYRDAEVVYDSDLREKAALRYKSYGDKAYVGESIGETSLMYLVEWLAGVEQAHYLLADHPDEVEDLFDAIHKNFLRRFEISVEHSPADTLALTENTSTTLISPDQYKKYCFPQICEYGNIVKKAGRHIYLHMCGHLKAILPVLNELPVTAFEAFTPPTVANTTFYDGRTACPDKCLIGGTNAAIWLMPAEKIISYIEENLDILPHHRGLFPSSAGVMPPASDPEKIKKVKDWLDTYPVRV